MPPDPNVHVGACAIVDRPCDASGLRSSQRGLLMLRRVGGVGLAADGYDTWSLPGGWLDLGESPEDAAVREVFEETGVTVKAESRAGYVVNHSERTIVTLLIRCEWVAGEPTITEPTKCQDVQWLTWDQIEDGRPLFAPLATWLRQTAPPSSSVSTS